MAGEGKDRQHIEGHVLEDLQEGDNRFHKNRNNSAVDKIRNEVIIIIIIIVLALDTN